ncbi:hypothetical protein [Pararhizobium sp. DWP3-4]|uniref:hypothetical protein n=1 Tax=Pararhizobium sp. DWP3-4 TaxID=2804565 RepID=UPI003CF61833
MGRTAEYSIKGYVYQFLRYLSEIIAADVGARITIEGAIEDIDVHTDESTTAVQCKYHEQAENFTLGKIYKPILLMAEHYSRNASTLPVIHYRLFCHFPDARGLRSLTRTELDTVLSTKSEPLKKIVARIGANADLDEFLSRLTIEFGQSVEELEKSVLTSLRGKGFSADDVEAVVFPTAVQRIVDLATKSSVADRTVDPVTFIAALRETKHVTFTRWTRELSTRGKIFQRLRKDLKPSLNLRSRRRYFVIDPTQIVNFDDEIVRFLRAFVERYESSSLANIPPLFAMPASYNVGRLVARLHDAGLRCADGMIGGTEFRIDNFFRKPMIRRTPFQTEFSLHIARRSSITELGPARPDELFLVNVSEDPWVHADVNVHRFEIERLSDLEYALQLRADYA